MNSKIRENLAQFKKYYLNIYTLIIDQALIKYVTVTYFYYN